MLTKPLIFLLTFLMTIVNFVIILIPVVVIGFPLFIFFATLFDKVGFNMLYFLVSRISFFMIIYIVADFIFGFTVRSLTKGTIPISKANSVHGHDDIVAVFEWLKKKFNMPGVKLYIGQDFAEVNAYAIGSVRRKSVVITMGLLERIKSQSANHEQYIDSVKGILGHEMSHLANKDYLPGLLVLANESANRKISSLIKWLFLIIANLLRIVPFVGRLLYNIVISAYNFVNFVVNSFLRFIFMPIFGFIKKWLGRAVEYRCDRESAYAFGGRCMSTALAMIGEGSYFSIFSTHPRTKSRINHVKDVKPESGTIRPGVFNSLANLLSIGLVVFVCAYSTYKTDVPGMYQHFRDEVYYPMKVKLDFVEGKVMEIYERVK